PPRLPRARGARARTSCPTRGRCSSRDGTTATRRSYSSGGPSSPERRNHLARQDAERPVHLLQGELTTRIQLGHDPGEPELVPQPGGQLGQARRGPERHAGLEDVLVREVRELGDPGLTPIGRPRVATPESGPCQLRVTAKEVDGVLARLLDGVLLGGSDVDGDAEAHVATPRVARLPPRRPVRSHVRMEPGDAQVAQPDEELESDRAAEWEHT